MRKRAGLARALVLDPEIVLFDEPDSGLDPVRTSFLNQLIIDLNAQIDATFLIVTHDINTARTVPDNIGLLYHRHLAMFGPREMLLSSEEPVVRQFLNAQTHRPDRHVGGEGRRRARRREGPGAAAAAAHPAAAGAVQRHPPPQPAPAGRVVPRERRHPAARVLRGEHVDERRGPDADVHRSTSSRVLAPDRHRGQAVRLRPRRRPRAVPAARSRLREFLQQAWFIASVTIIPTALVAIPFGAVIALQVGGLIKQFGAQSFTGSASVLAVVREAGPIATSLLIAGAGGSAIAADLGARKIREELDAMMVLGIDPIQRLVVPRVLACMLVAVFLNGLVSVVGVAGGYVFNVVLQDGTPGAYLASFTALAQLPDLWQGMAKALVFGMIAAIVACYKGMNAAGGPKGVGDAVNESVVITLHAAVRRQLRDERDLLPARATEDGLTTMARHAGASTRRPLGSLDDLGERAGVLPRRPGVDARARSAATRRRSCGSSPRSPSAPARWPSSAAPSA